MFQPRILSFLSVAFFVLSAITHVNALLRFPCSQLVTQRFDPFNLTMDPELDLGKLATCTTCRFKEDKSNYWTAVLYFKHPNGSYIRVPQMANHYTGAPNGGMTVYYFQPRPPTKDLKVVAFRKGFRMIVGDPMRRRDDLSPSVTAHKQLTFRCFQGNALGAGTPGVGPDDTIDLPKRFCSGGIRSNIYFPQCWDGMNLDSPDHASHVAHPVGTASPEGLQIFGTDCPASHPVRLPLLFMEIVWDTRPFNQPELWPEEGQQPFIFSMGDPTGYGQHADYVFGWEGDSLQRAMDVCTGQDGLPENCKELTLQSDDEINQCVQPVKVPEVTEGEYLKELPGCNPIQRGPDPATMVPNCNAVSTTVSGPFSTPASG
ncbi:hypothetical protein CC1G_13557 [Coprinopsis cinerea okayama7|uniref:DUF1996 domain-containing protein n=1 Tax=Coprinopsis cinerea (strain Okayama-7 / 130 / ATCC MYA-4618 / FGSC 9003) TaxID=240176 RepID=D6RK26_COPC7|nr:hypothetical protein CC1G_13557 [Coprinopsis cinerea okayama7\|eukprot:XP_002912029.1 hypothetical protein CC1G_13557 [Coprinopsis cinerea okayama7\